MLNVQQMAGKLDAVDIVQVFTTNLNGRPVTLQVNPTNVEAFFTRGIGFDGSSIPGYGTVDDSDKLLTPLVETFRKVEFSDESLGFLIGRIDEEQGARSQYDPRALLEKVVEEAEAEFGYRFLVAPEHEFMLLTGDEFSDDLHTDKAGYFYADPRDRGEKVRKKIVGILRKCGIQFEKMHHEVTPSQHEINLGRLDALGAADRTVLFTYVTQRVAHEHDLHATFMPKPFNGHNRNALHIHLSAQNQDGHRVFHSESATGHLSEVARHFIGGILRYARETSIVMAATFNSYKAYVVGKEAPIVRGWGLKNRSSMVRVPYGSTSDNTRIEVRSPDPSGNIYLQLAVLIGMGLQGIRDQLDCGEPDSGSTYDGEDAEHLMDPNFLPRNMFEALVEAERSRFLKGLMGASLYDRFMDLKTQEWEGYRTYVTEREHRRNLGT